MERPGHRAACRKDAIGKGYAMTFAIAALAYLAASALLLGLSASVDHVNLVAGRPIAVLQQTGFVPVWLYRYVLPVTLVIGLVVLSRLQPGKTGWLLVLRTAALAAVATVWLRDLVVHAPLLSSFQGGLLVVLLLTRHRPVVSRGNVVVAALAAALFGVVSYGATHGETRCDEPGYVTCLATGGPRYHVPRLLGAIGLAPFADLRGRDLAGANLRGAELRYADFTAARLQGADLSGAYLRRARLAGIDARGSHWRAAYLDGASLSDADLADADLAGIHAYRIDLGSADLRYADARDASLSHANLANALTTGLRLEGTYLRFSENLTQVQLDAACGDVATRLPQGLTIKGCR